MVNQPPSFLQLSNVLTTVLCFQSLPHFFIFRILQLLYFPARRGGPLLRKLPGDINSSPFGSPRAPRGTLLHLHFGIRHLFSRHRFQFPTHYVRGKPRPQQAPIQGSQLLFVDFAAEGTQLPFNSLPHHGGLIGRRGSLFSLRRSSFFFISCTECARRISARTATSYNSSSVSSWRGLENTRGG